VPEIGTDKNNGHAGNLPRRNKIKNIKKFIEGAETTGEKDESFSGEGQHRLAHEEMLEQYDIVNVFIDMLFAGQADGEADGFARAVSSAGAFVCRAHNARAAAGHHRVIKLADDTTSEFFSRFVMDALGHCLSRTKNSHSSRVFLNKFKSGTEFFGRGANLFIYVFFYFFFGHRRLFVYNPIMAFSFEIEKRLGRARAGILSTSHGCIETPAFVTVGTKATVKSLTPEQVGGPVNSGFVGAQVVLANTYHLYLEPGDEIIRDAGGLGKCMNWPGPTMTDSGGFQVFSLGAAFGKKVGKISPEKNQEEIDEPASVHETLAKIDEDGVSFKSVIDGSSHRFTPERSMEIQHNIGADIIFAFDECTSPHAEYEYQREAMERTHRWAQRSLNYHCAHSAGGLSEQALFGIVQGGRHKDLREESARVIGALRATDIDGKAAGAGFDGFGIGGSFDKEDMYSVVGWVNDILPEDKPRHLLGIGEPADIFGGIENGADMFDCVAPTRLARNGNLYSSHGRININNAKYRTDFGIIAKGPDGRKCDCYTCAHYTPAYLSHLFRSKEMLAATLASIHNLYFIVNLVKKIRQSILDDTFVEFKTDFLNGYYK